MTKGTVLVVDDEKNILSSLRRALMLEDFEALTASSGAEGLTLSAAGTVDLVLLDVAMPELDGLEVLRQLRKRHAELPVIMMSGHSTIEVAVQATKLGAFDFVEKPLSTERLLITIDNALRLSRLQRENADLRQAAGGEQAMLGRSSAMKRVFELIRKTAPTQGRVLITGENGTGKELVARAIHEQSARARGPFVRVNCAAIPKELIESELFGHERGAFTGASQQRKGKFELADKGTLFLDEIGDMHLEAQAKMLRALQENEIERVGGPAPIPVDVRVLAATNKVMSAELEAGRFREDLFYRLNVVPIGLPPLRERKEDIPLLASRFLDAACATHGKRPKALDEGATSLLMQHSWPGNVRELRNSIERLVILCDGDIGPGDVAEILPGPKMQASHYHRGTSLKDMVAAAERDLILRALADNEFQVAKTADALVLERSHLYKKMKALGIDHRA